MNTADNEGRNRMRKLAWITVSMGLLLLGTAARAAEVRVMQGWSRATPPGTDVGVGYFTLQNAGGKPLKLVGASSPRAASVEMHETRVDAKGLSTMRPVTSLTVAAGDAAAFVPGGRHLMLLGLKSPLVAGERVPLTLRFEGEAPVETVLEVLPLDATAPPAAGHEHHMH